MSHLDGTCDPDTCYSCMVLSVGIAASSMPTRKPQAVGDEARERRWSEDMPAYQRLRKDGLQPKGIDGSAHLERHAKEGFEVEYGTIAGSDKGRKKAAEIIKDMAS